MWVAVINMAILVWGMPTCVIPGTHLCLLTLCCHQNTPALLVYFLLLSSFGEKTVKVWELDGISLCWCQNCNIELILNLKYFFSCSLWPGLGLRSLFLNCSFKNKQTKKQKQIKTKNVAFSTVTMHCQASTRKKRAQGSWIGTPIFVYGKNKPIVLQSASLLECSLASCLQKIGAGTRWAFFICHCSIYLFFLNLGRGLVQASLLAKTWHWLLSLLRLEACSRKNAFQTAFWSLGTQSILSPLLLGT